MKSADTGSQASLAGRRLSCQESSGQHVSLPQGPGVFDRIGEKSLASKTLRHRFKPAAEARTIRSMYPSESSGGQVNTAEAGSRASLAGRRFGCQESSGQHASRSQGVGVFDRIGEKPLDLQEIRSHDTAPQEIPARVSLEVPRYRIEQDFHPGLLPFPARLDPRNPDFKAALAATRRQLESYKVTVPFDMSVLESLYSTRGRSDSKYQYLRASKTPTGEIRLTLSDDESPKKACRAPEANSNLTARAAVKSMLAREYSGVFNIARSDWVDETGHLTVNEAYWIGRRVKAAHGWGRQETPERVFLDLLEDCLRLGGEPDSCIELMREFNCDREEECPTEQMLIREALTGRKAEQPWMLELHREAREIYGDLVPDLVPDPAPGSVEEDGIAWMSHHVGADKLTVAFDERVLESPAGPEQFLRLNKSATGEFSLVLAEGDGDDKVCRATKAMQKMTTRFAFSNVLERRYPGVLASVQGYRDFIRLSDRLTLGEARDIWNAVKVQHEVEQRNGGKSFKDKLVRENGFLYASASLPRTVGPLNCVIVRHERGLSLEPGSGQDAARIHYLPPAAGPRDLPSVELPPNPGEDEPRVVMIMDLKEEDGVKICRNLESLRVSRGWFMPPQDLIDQPTVRELTTEAHPLEFNDAITWILPEAYYRDDGRYRKAKPTRSELYKSYRADCGANLLGEFAVAPGELEKRWHFYVQDAGSNIFLPLSASGEPR